MRASIMDDPAIRIESLSKTYAGKGIQPNRALDNVSFDVPRGQIFGLLGPNGAGKSTLINILAGLVVKTGGKVTIWGFDIDQHPRNSKRAIGVDPVGSLYYDFVKTGRITKPFSYKVEGIGEDFMPKTLNGQVVDEWAMHTSTRGGSSDTDVKELAAMPDGPSGPWPVMTVTPGGSTFGLLPNPHE